MKNSIWILILFNLHFSFAQETTKVSGFISGEGRKIQAANVHLLGSKQKTVSDSLGFYAFENVALGNYTIQISQMGFQTLKKKIEVTKDSIQSYDFELTDNENQLNEVVVSGTLKPVKRL
ncbi:MAG: carboxypeptidase-like regulatory domain-containing protein, partial [Flavobacterium sp.]